MGELYWIFLGLSRGGVGTGHGLSVQGGVETFWQNVSTDTKRIHGQNKIFIHCKIPIQSWRQ